MDYKDYYAVLGVAREVGANEIKKAFRKLARKYHPDVSKEADAEKRMQEINEANAVLSDPEKRAAYDQLGRAHRAGEAFKAPPDWDAGFEFSGEGGPHADAGEFSEFFSQLFGRMGREPGRGRAGNARGEDHHAKVMLDIEDAYRGATRQIGLRLPQLDESGHLTLATRTLQVRIPKGVREGQMIRLAGQGAPAFAGGTPGDLMLEVHFAPHARFRVDGRDLYMTMPVAPWECALGAEIELTLPDGGAIMMRVPAGAQGGSQLRVRGKGIPGDPPGDLFLDLAVRVPPAASARARELYQAMASELAFDPRAEWSEVSHA